MGCSKKPFFMKKILFAGLFIVASCRKGDLPVADPRNGHVEFKQCVITRVDGSGSGPGDPNAPHQIITYNNHRDPVLMEPTFVGTGSPRRVFYYDNRGRLATFAGIYDNGAFEFWHNYVYDKRGRITGDSTYIFGSIYDPGTALERRYARLFYDTLERVIMEVQTSNAQSHPGPDTVRYRYDIRGNLDGDFVTYDDKVNPYLTNRIWRFLARDYSVNNMMNDGIRPSAYNDHGMPILYVGDTWYGIALWGVYGSEITIQYDCRNGPDKGW